MSAQALLLAGGGADFGGLRGTLFGKINGITNPAPLNGSVFVIAGDLIVVVSAERDNLTSTAVTDNLGNSYTAQNAGTDAGNVTGRAFYSRVTVAGELTTINISCTASADKWAGVAAVYQGLFVTSPIDVNTANITSDITSPFACPATGTLSQADELVVCWGANDGADLWSATAPLLLSIANSQGGGGGVGVVVGSKVVSATTTTSPEFIGPNPSQTILGTMSFKRI